MDPLETVRHYHEQTTHRPNRYARSLGYLDWANQPDPFRRYADAPLVQLALSEPSGPPAYDGLYEPGAIPPQPVTLASVSEFLQYALALSAWKEAQGSRWALRINPSSGNLHPTEGYIALGVVPELTDAPGVFHYAPKEHALERRCTIADADWQALLAGFPAGTFLAGLTSIHWREAWKYGERAYRYCQHDVGHALAALALSAALQGWQVQPLTGLGDAQIALLFGLDAPADEGVEREHPDAVIAVMQSRARKEADQQSRARKGADQQSRDRKGAGDALALPHALPAQKLQASCGGPWLGRPNRLSSEHVAWEIIDAVADACEKAAGGESTEPSREGIPAAGGARKDSRTSSDSRTSDSDASARGIIHQRRSAVAMDGQTRLAAERFYAMLDRVQHRPDAAPWSALGYGPHVHLGLMVHRVDGLEPGLYLLVRRADALVEFQTRLPDTFTWEKPGDCPADLPLHHLVSGDARRVADQVSCGQDIAADGVFSLGMLAEFERPLADYGPWFYRRLFWETGMIGQVLYLEAEAAGLRATGIGCFFDDLVHDLFGLTGHTWQSLYHFTVGGAVEDTRLITLPPYA